jgi:hypothetical protein
MKLAVLFWFYKDVEICVNRLQLLRKHNKHIEIYGLYGGNLKNAKDFERALAPYLNDFYCFDGIQDPLWKWRNGDLMIATWYRERGVQFNWDTIAVVQADMLVLDNVHTLFKGLKKEEILLSSVRPVKEVLSWWYWISEHKGLYQDFYQYLVEKYGYKQEPVCCQFVVACLPQTFLKKFSEIENPELGFIEYRVPMYAQLFGVPFSNLKGFDCWWGDDPQMKEVPVYNKTLIADKVPIPLWVVLYNSLLRKNKIFHPFDYFFPFTISGSILLAKQLVNEKGVKRLKMALSNKTVLMNRGFNR